MFQVLLLRTLWGICRSSVEWSLFLLFPFTFFRRMVIPIVSLIMRVVVPTPFRVDGPVGRSQRRRWWVYLHVTAPPPLFLPRKDYVEGSVSKVVSLWIDLERRKTQLSHLLTAFVSVFFYSFPACSLMIRSMRSTFCLIWCTSFTRSGLGPNEGRYRYVCWQLTTTFFTQIEMQSSSLGCPQSCSALCNQSKNWKSILVSITSAQIPNLFLYTTYYVSTRYLTK